MDSLSLFSKMYQRVSLILKEYTSNTEVHFPFISVCLSSTQMLWITGPDWQEAFIPGLSRQCAVYHLANLKSMKAKVRKSGIILITVLLHKAKAIGTVSQGSFRTNCSLHSNVLSWSLVPMSQLTDIVLQYFLPSNLNYLGLKIRSITHGNDLTLIFWHFTTCSNDLIL